MADWSWAPVPGLPHARDVGTMNGDTKPWTGNINWWTRAYCVGTDGSLWRINLTGPDPQQIPSPARLARVSVSPDLSVWCVDQDGVAWVTRDEANWTTVAVLGAGKLIDVDAAPDRSVWFVDDLGGYYVKRNDSDKALPVPVFVALKATAGFGQPTFDAAGQWTHVGSAWGVATSGSRLMYSEGTWTVKAFDAVADISTAPDFLWMVKSDSTVWVTNNGTTELRRGELTASRVACNYVGNALVVRPDGSIWIWGREAAPPSFQPPEKPPTITGSRPPQLSFRGTSGSGAGTVYKLAGSDFLPNRPVSIRGSLVLDGRAVQAYAMTQSDGSGTWQYETTTGVPTGTVVHFSANDGRTNSSDFTGTLWSNTIDVTCP